MVSRDATERRVYVLPTELLGRLRAYQTACGIASEVEAARRLLDAALQMRETINNILDKLSVKYGEEQDLRVLAREVLVTHSLVQEITINDNRLEFKMRNGARGQIGENGSLFIAESEESYFRDYVPPKPPGAAPSTPAPPRPTPRTPMPSWDAPRGGGDLDDEIPF